MGKRPDRSNQLAHTITINHDGIYTDGIYTDGIYTDGIDTDGIDFDGKPERRNANMVENKAGTSEVGNKPIIVGNVVTGSDFFGREKEISRFMKLIESGSHVMLLGQRRMGKSSLMLETANRLRKTHVCLYVDIEYCDCAEDVVIKLGKSAHEHKGLIESAKDGFFDILKGLRDSIDEVGADTMVKIKLRERAAENWISTGDKILDWLSGIEKPVVVFIDELPVFINRIMRDGALNILPEKKKDADMFLSWLRSAGNRHAGKITFAAGGSIGIEPILEQAGLSDRLNTFNFFPLPPWDHQTALAFLEDRGRGNGVCFEKGAKERILEKLGVAIPHFVQKFLQNIAWNCMDRNADSCGIEDIDRIYQSRLLAVQGSIELATYVQRLERTLGRDKFRLARELLCEAAIAGRLTGRSAMILAESYYSDRFERADVIRLLIKTFEHDGYLQQEGGDYVFKNNLLRDYWEKEFSFNFIPSGQRRNEAQEAK